IGKFPCAFWRLSSRLGLTASALYDTETHQGSSFKQSHREKSLQTLMRVNLLKRLESSVDSFRITL
ncbi:hypothetical protein BMR10_17820, partial [Methylococcaceae bacterium CS4]